MFKLTITDNKGECLKMEYFLTKPSQKRINGLRMRLAKSLGCIPKATVYHVEKNYAGEVIERAVS